ncbi:MAG: hypothetical protein ACI8S6_005566 [Myxococcota bacterium]|jgi:hypothetical protein
MTDRGPEGTPFFVLVGQDSDPDGKTFCNRVGWVVCDREQPARAIKGVVRRLSSGRRTYSTTDDLDLASHLYTQLCLIAAAPDMLMLAMGDGSITGSRLVENLSIDDDLVASLRAGERAWFCLVDREASTRLVVDRDRDGICQRLGEEVSGEAAICGQVQRDRCGNLRLLVRSAAAPRLRRAIAQWGQTGAASWPALRALPGAPIIAR